MTCPSIGGKGVVVAVICALTAISACIALAVALTVAGNSPQDVPRPAFDTGVDMLDYLLNLRKIDRKDGLLVSWYHAANRKSELEEALKSIRARNVQPKPMGLLQQWNECLLLQKALHQKKHHAVVMCDGATGRKGQQQQACHVPDLVELHASAGDAMVVEADVINEAYNTPNETDKPIMAHPPDIYSDNSLQEWLDAVLNSSDKAIKLDFKSIKAVGPSLDILVKKSSQVNIDRPIWLNADILKGPNVPINTAVNASLFLSLIQEKFPNCTVSPGWTTLYLPLFPNTTYTQRMVEEMHSLVGKLPQPITFPVRAVMARPAWPHLSWLLSQSKRYSLTLWQGKSDPVTMEDLLFIRDHSHPEQIYYDIYEPVLSQFKDAAYFAHLSRQDPIESSSPPVELNFSMVTIFSFKTDF